MNLKDITIEKLAKEIDFGDLAETIANRFNLTTRSRSTLGLITLFGAGVAVGLAAKDLFTRISNSPITEKIRDQANDLIHSGPSSEYGEDNAGHSTPSTH